MAGEKILLDILENIKYRKQKKHGDVNEQYHDAPDWYDDYEDGPEYGDYADYQDNNIIN